MGGQVGLKARWKTENGASFWRATNDLVLGAGSSYGARVDDLRWPYAPPMGDNLAAYLLGWLAANAPRQFSIIDRINAGDERHPTFMDPEFWDSKHHSDLEDLLRKASQDATQGLTFEAAVEQAIGASDLGLLRHLNMALAVSLLGGIGCRFAPGSDRLDELVAALGAKLTGIVTLNCDLLTEEALTRAKLGWEYQGVAHVGHSGIPVFKVHGSANLKCSPRSRALIAGGSRQGRWNAGPSSIRLREPHHPGRAFVRVRPGAGRPRALRGASIGAPRPLGAGWPTA